MDFDFVCKVIGKLVLQSAQLEERTVQAEATTLQFLGQFAAVSLGKLLPSQLHVDLQAKTLTIVPPPEPVVEKKE